MRTTVATTALLLAVVAAPASAPAQAADVAPPPPQVFVPAPTVGVAPAMMPVDQARDIAVMNGVIDISRIELDDGMWKVKGHDNAGRRVEMEIDPLSGEIAQLERFD